MMMKKAIMIVLIFCMCSCSPTTEFLLKIDGDCNKELGFYGNPSTETPSVKGVRCLQRKLNDAYNKGTFTEGQDFWNQRLNSNALLAERFEKGEITVNEYIVLKDAWLNNYNNEARLQEMQDAEQTRENQKILLMQQSIENNQQRSLNCNSMDMGGGMISTNCN